MPPYLQNLQGPLLVSVSLMSWARLDDAMWRNPKVQAVARRNGGPEAVYLFVMMIAFSADQLTDGIVDNRQCRQLVDWSPPRLGARLGALVSGGLLQRRNVSRGIVCYTIHDYLEYNPSRADVLTRRGNNRQRQQRHRGQLRIVTP